MQNSTIDQYAVFGNPVEHSKSPKIHTLFAEQTHQIMHYDKRLINEGEFEQQANQFFESGGKGLNITVPFKLDAYGLAARLTSRARRAGAVNCLSLQNDGILLGDNTDGIGLVNDMTRNLSWTLADTRILVLGAGGAVRGVLQPLMEQNPRELVIANRTVAKALQLARGFKDLGNIKACGYDDLKGQTFDIVVNGTSASLAGDLPPLPTDLLNDNACCYDMMYGSEPTVFMHWATSCGCERIADGLGMLVEQAAESFLIWRAITPDVKPVLALLRQQL